MNNDVAYDIDSNSEAIPVKQSVQVRMKKPQKKILTPQTAQDLLDRNLDFQTDSSDLLSYDADFGIGLSSEVRPPKKTKQVRIPRQPRAILTPNNVPNLMDPLELLSEASQSSENGDFISDSQNYSSSHIPTRANNIPTMPRNVDINSESQSEPTTPINTQQVNTNSRETAIKMLAAMAYAGYETFYQNK